MTSYSSIKDEIRIDHESAKAACVGLLTVIWANGISSAGAANSISDTEVRLAVKRVTSELRRVGKGRVVKRMNLAPKQYMQRVCGAIAERVSPVDLALVAYLCANLLDAERSSRELQEVLDHVLVVRDDVVREVQLES